MESMQVEQISLGRLRESPTNPRKFFDSARLAELAESIRTSGVLNPILGRPLDFNGYSNGQPAGESAIEIVQGHRRARAARLAKLETVPVLLRAMSDVEVMECQLIELEQSEDIHALGEAALFRSLMDAGQKVEQVAKTAGKSTSHVWQRLKLLELIPEAQEMFVENKITAGHAVPIARLRPEQQKQALEVCYQDRWGRFGKDADGNETSLISVRDLLRWIAESFHLVLARAPFPSGDKWITQNQLKIRKCGGCPDNTATNPDLYPEIKKKEATCTNAECYARKVAAFVQVQITELSNEYDTPPLLVSGQYQYAGMTVQPGVLYAGKFSVIEKNEKPCKLARWAVLVDVGPQRHLNGRQIGSKLLVCADDKCPVHQEARTPFAKSPAQREEDQAKVKALRLSKEIRSRTLDAILQAKVTKTTLREEYNVMAVRFLHLLDQDGKRALYKRRGWDTAKLPYSASDAESKQFAAMVAKMRPPELRRLLLEIALLSEIHVSPWQEGAEKPSNELNRLAKLLKLDPAAIARETKKAPKGPAIKAQGSALGKKRAQ